ncbi:MAG: 5-(carboxyamino)imidazole ribonucleotide synthase, partial [Caulobacterales bacterium]
MLALAAARLGFDVVGLERKADSPAGRTAAKLIVADYGDEAALAELASLTNLVTYEFENVPAGSVAWLAARGVDVAPGPRALAVAQDRFEEKTFLNANGAPTVA